MDQPFNPRQLPVVFTEGYGIPPAPPPSSPMSELIVAFYRGAGQDLRASSRFPIASLLLTSNIESEISPDGDKTVSAEMFDGEKGASVSFTQSPEGYLSIGITFTAKERASFAHLLDFAAAGLAAMDQHALSNGWQS